MPRMIKGERSQILNGLISGRVRAASAKDGSLHSLPFHQAVAEATQEELLWALSRLINARGKYQTYRTKRIAVIEAILRQAS